VGIGQAGGAAAVRAVLVAVAVLVSLGQIVMWGAMAFFAYVLRIGLDPADAVTTDTSDADHLATAMAVIAMFNVAAVVTLLMGATRPRWWFVVAVQVANGVMFFFRAGPEGWPYFAVEVAMVVLLAIIYPRPQPVQA